MSLKNMLKKYKAVPRNEPPPPPAPEPVNKKLCYLQELHESYVSKHKEYVSSTSSTMSTAPVPPQSSRGLGLLFIIIDDLPHEYIWRTFIRMHEEQQRRSNSCDINPIRVWIHAKYPQHVNSAWVKSHLVDFCIPAEWGSIELTKIMVRLLEKAVVETHSSDDRNEGNDRRVDSVRKFCFISESCLPAMLPNLAMDLVFADSCSWIRWTRQPNNGYAKQGQFDKLAINIPNECIAKADQWLLLNRQHAIDIIELVAKLRSENAFHDSIFGLFKKVHASDEMFFPTCLSLLGHLPTCDDVIENHSAHVIKRRATFCNWTEDNARNPMTFSSLLPAPSSPSLYAMAQEERCIFMRKLKVPETAENCFEVRRQTLSKWLSLIVQHIDSSKFIELVDTCRSSDVESSNDLVVSGGEGMEEIRQFVISQCIAWADSWIKTDKENMHHVFVKNGESDERREGSEAGHDNYDGQQYDNVEVSDCNHRWTERNVSSRRNYSNNDRDDRRRSRCNSRSRSRSRDRHRRRNYSSSNQYNRRRSRSNGNSKSRSRDGHGRR